MEKAPHYQHHHYGIYEQQCRGNAHIHIQIAAEQGYGWDSHQQSQPAYRQDTFKPDWSMASTHAHEKPNRRQCEDVTEKKNGHGIHAAFKQRQRKHRIEAVGCGRNYAIDISAILTRHRYNWGWYVQNFRKVTQKIFIGTHMTSKKIRMKIKR